jgi:hypothetical protein
MSADHLRSGACGLSALDLERGLTAAGVIGLDGERIMIAPDEASLLIEEQRRIFLEVLGPRRDESDSPGRRSRGQF